ncbi:MAG: alpha/beta fold hydrolase [Rhodanobacteraceae bacterium]
MQSLHLNILKVLTVWLLLLPGLALAGKPVTLHAADDVSVFGTFSRAAADNDKIILLFHQARANRHEYDAVVPDLTSAGFDTLAIDQRSGGDLFGGHNQTVAKLGKSADYIDAMPDLEAALSWAQARHYKTIVVVGSSYSSALVIVLAAQHPQAISAVASFSPGEYYKDKNLIKNAAAKVSVPFYITTDPDEESNVVEVLSKAHGDNITHYKPVTGVHGASTLVKSRDPKGYQANLKSFLDFLEPIATNSAQAERSDDSGMLGFTADGARLQRALEQRFDSALNAGDLRAWMKRMASQPNHVGSLHDKANAQFMLEKFRDWGWDAHIETFDVLYPTPKSVAMQLLSPVRYDARLHESPVAGDATSSLPGALPPFNAYGADGDVTADLVYVNYGMPDDYKALARHGIDVRGKIVITRYGGGWRGLKPKLAQEHGAVACLIYSDPRNDGYFQGDIYPKGGWRPADGVQRGSVLDMQQFPGDPLTPGYGSTANAKRVALADARTVLKIPVLPISWADATPLLHALGGPVAPENWRGALPLTYHMGPGPARVHVSVKSNWDRKPIYDVIARIKGSTWPDQWVVRGNHHDGWVFGAWDPLAGNVAMLAEAKAIGTLLKSGWRPRRTLVYASWDGEEPGLLGSTEWVETHADELQAKAVMYVNSDTNARGYLFAGGSHSLQHLLNQVAAGVDDPETSASVSQRRRAVELISASEHKGDDKKIGRLMNTGMDVPIEALGSGSDYSAFLEHLGIASLNLGFGGEDDDAGIYHSRYDSFDHYIRFGDPTFAYGVALAKVAGHIVLRSANARVLPMRFDDFSATLDRYVDELHALVKKTRKQTAQQHDLLKMGVWELGSDPKHPQLPPQRLSDMPKIELADLDMAAHKLAESATAWRTAWHDAAAAGLKFSPVQLTRINRAMARMEQDLTDADGLPGRGWYRHMIYAPGLLTGYGVKTIPGVREAIEGRRWAEADKYAVISARVLDRYRGQLDQLTAMLQAASD